MCSRHGACSAAKALAVAVSFVFVSLSSAAGALSGSGTAESPYLIGSTDDWNTFASNVVDGTSGEAAAHYRLSADVSGVTNTVGTSESACFQGVFDGNGHTLSVAITDTDNQGTAPFRWISNAVISNLTVTGCVTGTTHTAGLVGFTLGSSLIESCRVSADVTVGTSSGNRHMGGVVGHAKTSSLTMKDVVFDGTMYNSGNYAGGLQGWSDGNALSLTNCLFCGTYSGSANFHPIAINTEGATTTCELDKVYYTKNPNFSDSKYIPSSATGTRVDLPSQAGTLVKTMGSVLGTEFGEAVSVKIAGLSKTYGITNSVADFSYSVTFNGESVTKDTHYTAALSLNGESVSGLSASAPGEYTLTISGVESAGYYGSHSEAFYVVGFEEDANGNIVIDGADDWNMLAASVEAGTNWVGRTFVLSNDVGTVSTTVGTEANPFTGVFDGAGHTIDVAIVDTSAQGTAPFRWISNAVVSNLTVTGSVTGTTHTAGFIGFSTGTNRIESCRVSADVTVGTSSGSRHMGGVVGHAKTSSLTMKDVVFDGTMHTDSDYAGGLVGWSDGNFLAMTNCLFGGTFSGKGKFHPVALVNHGMLSAMSTALDGVYYTTDPNASFSGSNVTGKIAATGTKVYTSLQTGRIMEKGSVLNVEFLILVSAAVDGICDLYGITNSVADFSYTVSFDGVPVTSNVEYTASYTLNGEQVSGVSDPGKYVLTIAGVDTAGFCGSCTREFLVLSFTEDSSGSTVLSGASDWNQLSWCCEAGVSWEGKTVVLSNDVSGASTTVGTEANPFNGVFDGAGHTIDAAIVDMDNQGTAPFRWISNAVISNLTVTGSVTGAIHTSGLVGFSMGTNRIETCRVSTDVAVGTTSGNRHMGGVVGHAKTSSLTMKDVVFDGTMHTDGDFAGGLQGWSDGNFLAMTNCLFSGTFSGSGKFHPVAMVNYGDVSKMRTAVEGGYYTTGPNADFSGSSVKGKIAAAGTRVYDSLQDGKVMTKTTVMGDEVWIPVSVVMDGLCDLYGITNTVADFSYTVSFDGVPVASNVEYTASYTLNGEQVAGVSAPGKYVLTIAGAEAQGFYGSCTREFLVLSFTEDSNGNTVLSSAYDWAQLSWSCEAGVSWEGKTVVLSNDIGTVSAMVGTSGHPFNGVFDGAGHTLDVAITNTSATGMSPFQYISNATISNLVVTGSVVGNKHVSGLVGMTSGTCVIDSCKVAASVELPGDGWVGSMMGGFVGQAQYATLTIRNCVFSGSMSSPGGYVGGFQGWSDTNHATVSNCLFCGEYSTSVSGHTFFNPIGTRLDTATSVVYNAYYTRAPQWGSNGDTHRKQFDGTAASKTPYASGISRSVTIMDESCYVTVSASVSGLKTAYSNGTNADGLGLTVLFDGAEAEYGVDYDIVISNSTEAVSGAISPGSYTATIVGREGAGYYGSAAAGSFFVSEFDIDGDGSMLVKSNDDLESIARYVTNGMDFAGMTFKLADSILDATAIIGTQDHPFRGVFDGNGKAIFVDIQDTDNQGTALFRCISNATITNLSVGGSVKGTTHAAGLVGFALDSNLIADCEVDVSVAVEPSDASAGKHAGGIVGHSKTSTLTMRDTFYSGTISNDTHYAGGLVGWCDGGVIAVTNSFFCGKHEGTAAFHPIACRAYWVGVTCQLEDAYYTLEPTLENPAYMPSDMHPTFAYLSLDGAPFCRFVKFIGRAPVYLPVTVSMDGLCRTYGITNSVDDFSYTVSFDGVAATNGVQYIAYLTKDGVDVERPEEDGEYVLTVTAIKDSGFYNSHSNKFRVGYAIVDTGTDAFEDGYCYKVASDVAPTNRIIVSGSATLLLCDNTTLTVNRGIGVSDGNALEIVAESYGENAGRLIAELPEGNRMYECAAIGATYSESAFAGTITIRGGRITAKGGKSASGIGCARVSNAGAVNILGGQVTAISGYGQSSAIEAGTITLGWTGPDDFISTSTEDGLYGAYYDDVTFVSKFVLDGTTEVATESNIDNKKIVPPFSLGFPDCCNGSGTEADPYLIRASPQWDALATAVSGAYDTADKHFLLCNDISVTNCIGYLGNGVTNAFSGVFDGGSHTIDVKLSKSSVQCVAPFSRIRNATIKNLKAIGSVLGGRHSAGLVGGAYGTNLIENCVVSVDVKVQEMYCGGILGHGCDSATTIRGCVFDGGVRSLWEQYRYLGTIWGWSDTAAKPVLIDCLDLSDSDKPVGTGGGNPVVSNVIYTASEKITYSEGHPWSDNLWVKGSSGTVKPCFIGPETTDYGFVKAYRSGFLCNGSYYAEEFATSASGKTVPASWLDRFYDSSTTDYPTKIDSTAANGRKVWECYIADVSPTDADADLIATIGLVDGKMKVTVLNGESADRVYTVLGTQTLDPAETPADVTDADDLSTTDYRFFRIAVDLP